MLDEGGDKFLPSAIQDETNNDLVTYQARTR